MLSEAGGRGSHFTRCSRLASGCPVWPSPRRTPPTPRHARRRRRRYSDAAAWAPRQRRRRPAEARARATPLPPRARRSTSSTQQGRARRPRGPCMTLPPPPSTTTLSWAPRLWPEGPGRSAPLAPAPPPRPSARPTEGRLAGFWVLPQRAARRLRPAHRTTCRGRGRRSLRAGRCGALGSSWAGAPARSRRTCPTTSSPRPWTLCPRRAPPSSCSSAPARAGRRLTGCPPPRCLLAGVTRGPGAGAREGARQGCRRGAAVVWVGTRAVGAVEAGRERCLPWARRQAPPGGWHRRQQGLGPFLALGSGSSSSNTRRSRRRQLRRGVAARGWPARGLARGRIRTRWRPTPLLRGCRSRPRRSCTARGWEGRADRGSRGTARRAAVVGGRGARRGRTGAPRRQRARLAALARQAWRLPTAGARRGRSLGLAQAGRRGARCPGGSKGATTTLRLLLRAPRTGERVWGARGGPGNSALVDAGAPSGLWRGGACPQRRRLGGRRAGRRGGGGGVRRVPPRGHGLPGLEGHGGSGERVWREGRLVHSPFLRLPSQRSSSRVTDVLPRSPAQDDAQERRVAPDL